MKAALIGIDWGTTNLRAFRFDSDGRVTETRQAPLGLSAIVDRDFEGALSSVIKDWLALGATPVVISGMAGSREGWIETPYISCPVNLATLAQAMAPVPTKLCQAWIVPGLASDADDGLCDVMRGEETQIFGAMEDGARALAIAPGTHSKWAHIDSGRVLDIRTYVTGEMFALTRAQSIVGRLIDGDAPNDEAFRLGAHRGLQSASLLNLLFSVRTEGLLKHIEPKALSAYLSGILIGAEIADGLRQQGLHDMPITVIGAEAVADLYRIALELAGASGVQTISGEAAAARGLWRLASLRTA